MRRALRMCSERKPTMETDASAGCTVAVAARGGEGAVSAGTCALTQRETNQFAG